MNVAKLPQGHLYILLVQYSHDSLDADLLSPDVQPLQGGLVLEVEDVVTVSLWVEQVHVSQSVLVIKVR